MDQIKLVIWDLDDTFWSGTLSEGGGVSISENLELVKELSDRGIVNSICSKNDFKCACDRLVEQGVWDLFVFPSIDWTNKGGRIKQIVDDMQLRPTNVLFVDDNVNNREEAAFACDGINVADPSELPELVTSPAFEGKNDKAHSRLKQYKVLEEKTEARKASASNDEFLMQSEIKCEIVRDWRGEVDRAHELIMRTNQLNFTKDRISAEETAALFDVADDSGLVHVSDKYGDHGFVGFFAVVGGECVQFCFSCRTMGMGIEQYVYASIGFPKLKVVGEVANELNSSDMPTWINQHEVAPADRSEVVDHAAEGQLASLLIYGGCILRPVQAYCEGELGASEAIYDTPGNYLPATNISGVWSIGAEDRQHILDNVSALNAQTWDTRLASPQFGFMLICMQTGATRNELSFYKYVKKDGSGQHFYTDKLTEMNANTDILEQYVETQVTADDIYTELCFISDHLDGKLVILTLPDYERLDAGKDREYWDRLKLNEVAERVATEKDNILLLDMRKYMRSPADSYDGNIAHYNREIGWKIALGLIELMGVRSQAIAPSLPSTAPKNAVRSKENVQSSDLADTPEYVAFIRNGYFHINCAISHPERYEVRYVCRLDRRVIENTEYASIFDFKRALTQPGRYWATVYVRPVADPSKEYRFNTAKILFSEYVAVNFLDPSQPDFTDSLKGVSAFFSKYPAARLWYRRIAQELLFLKSHGVTIGDWFKKKGVSDVSLYCDEDLYPLILQSIEGTDFHLRYKFIDELMRDFCPDSGFGSWYGFTEWTGSYVGPLDTVLVGKSLVGAQDDAYTRIRAAGARPVTLPDVINGLVTDVIFNQMLPQRLSERGLNIPVVVFQTPTSAQQLVVCSASDKDVVGWGEGRILRAKRNGSGDLPRIFRGIPLEELEETMTRPGFYRRSDAVMTIRDKRGEFLNVSGGRRVTTGQPDESHGRIFMFGHKGLFGAGVRDSDTIASKLQSLVPGYRVENCANYWNLTDWEQNMLGGLIRSIEFRQGDIVCLQCQDWAPSADPLLRAMRFEAIASPLIKVDCNRLFQTPNAPDLFLMDSSSLAPWGNEKVAELLRDTFIQHDLLETISE